jgi:hypothetical protein
VKKTPATSRTPVGRWKKLNWELYRASENILGCLRDRVAEYPGDPSLAIALGFVVKATKTLKAVNILYDSHLEEQAQVLVRVLFELRLNFDCFLRMIIDDLRGTCLLVTDSMMLEKIKQIKASDFAGVSDELKQEYEEFDKDMSSRYTPSKLRNMAKYGFTGVSIEGRARLTGHEDAYNIVYRNFSRNVHSTDYVEHSVHLSGEDRAEYAESRDIVGLYTAHFSAGGIAEFANLAFRCGLEDELNRIGLLQAQLKAM